MKKSLKKYEKNELGARHVIGADTNFDTIETYKSIRTNIMFSLPNTEAGKLIAITSAAPSEGKTTCAINLAITFAQMGAKVVLLDCDLRKARVHRYLEIERQKGISDVLCGFIPLESAIRSGVRPNLDVLTAGEIPPNPAELLESAAFVKMLGELSSQYDYVFIDTPPVSVVTDSAIIMKQCSGVVVIVRQNVTAYDLLDITMKDIAKTGVKNLGVVMLNTDVTHKKYGYYKKGKYGYKYKYKYGYRYGEQYGDVPGTNE
jgi:capsular exopolysaccharide synthesis family protein